MGSVLSADCGFCTVQPRFTLKDKERAVEMLAAFVDATRSEAGCVYYGFTVCGSKLFCREAYVSGDAVKAHLENVGSLLQTLLDENNGPASLDSIAIHGPAVELDKVREMCDPLNATYFTFHSGFTNVYLGRESPHSFCTIQPTFKLLKADEFLEVAGNFVNDTKKEAGCIWYGWTISDDKVFCREAYRDGRAVDDHLKNVLGKLGPLLDSGVLELESFEIHGPETELEKVKPTCDPLGAQYFAIEGEGFAKFATSFF